MKFIKSIANSVWKALTQNDTAYDFSYDVAQKITFLLTALVLWAIPVDLFQPGVEFGIFIFCCIFGRIVVMSVLQMLIDRLLKERGGRKSSNYFLSMPPFIWRVIVLIFVVYITVKDMLLPRYLDDFIMVIPAWVIMGIVAFHIFALRTEVVCDLPDPTKKGSPAWQEANGIEAVRHSLINPIYRDKNGNYYGQGWVPVAPPVEILNKEHKRNK